MSPVTANLPALGERRWDQKINPIIRDLVEQSNANEAAIANLPESDALIINADTDLSSLLVGDEYILPTGLVIISGTVDLGDKALRMSAGTVIAGNAVGVVTSTADGVVRASGLASAVILREFNIVATGGKCLDVSGPITQQFNAFFVGLFGVGSGTSAGTVTDFDVASFKDCFINAPDGLTFDGTTNKTFVSHCPFYSITGSAIRFASTYDGDVVDIVTSFFKFDSPGVGVEAEAGYSVGDGLLRGSLRAGTAIPLSGLAPSDVNWSMEDNLGVRDSRIAAQAYLTAPATMTIASAGVYYPVTGVFTTSSIIERFELTGDNQLTYIGRTPTLVDFTSSFTIDTSNNNRLGFRASKNGVGLPETTVFVEQGAGPGSSPRGASVVGLIEAETGDVFGLQVANLDNTASVEWLSATFAVRG